MYSTLRQLYEEQGLTGEEIDQLLVLDVRPQSYFTGHGFRDQHAGGQAFAHDEEIMNWIFAKERGRTIPEELEYGFFLNEDSLFFITNEGITEVGRTIQRTQMLDIPTSGNLAFDGRTIYFINEDSLLSAYDTRTHKEGHFGMRLPMTSA